MKFFNIVGNSFGCSASGERLVSAARDGDLQEAKALLDYNPRLVRYSTFGVRNSPLHYSAAHGHHEIVSLLLESRVDINLRNYRGQTALMQACQHGHWEVIQTLILSKANIHRADYLNGGTALHLAALNGHTLCIRILLVDYLPSLPNLWNMLQKGSNNEDSNLEFNQSALYQVINKPADGGITALHMAALNGHFETVQLLLDLGASVSEVTIEDGSTIDLIGAGSTPLHYAACGGNVQCCQILTARHASLTAQNANGWTALMVARSWHRSSVEEILSRPQESQTTNRPSPYLSLPLSSIVKIARECGWRSEDFQTACQDPCVICLERKCTVAAEGCEHEFCTQCAVQFCLLNTSTLSVSIGPPGSIACPLCRAGIVAFTKLPGTRPAVRQFTRSTSLSLSLWACSSEQAAPPQEQAQLTAPLCGAHPPRCSRSASTHSTGSSFRSMSSQRFRSACNPGLLCMGGFDGADPSVVACSVDGSLGRCSRSSQLRRSSSDKGRRSWLCSLDNYIVTGGNG